MKNTKLFNESDYKNRARLILNNIDGVRAELEKFNAELFVLGQKLDNSTSFPLFFEVVDEVVSTEVKLDKLLLKEMKGLNKSVKDIIINEINDKTEFQFLTKVLHFNQIITDKILENKERLSLMGLKDNLSKEEYERVKNFLHSIRVLKPITELLEQQKANFRTQLESASSMEEISDIEDNIDIQDVRFEEAYQTLVNFPDDEKTAGAIIEFLSKNQHVKSIMESFDFAESLIEDVLSAKSRIQLARSMSIN